MKVAILCSDDAHHGYLVDRIAERFSLSLLVVEPARYQRLRVRHEKRYRDWFWAVYHHSRREIFGLNRYRQEYFGNAKPQSAGAATCMSVEWVNDAAVAAALTASKSDVTIVMGTSILKGPVLDAAGTAINIHGGFLPFYRGNHCFFFALYEGAFHHIGSTIHFIDRGIDTGDIIQVVVPTLLPDDNAEKLYSRSEKLAIHRLIELLAALERGTSLPRSPQPKRGRLFRTRDRGPFQEFLLWFRLRTGITRIPPSFTTTEKLLI
jgi:folate-dependent phosphoribosylglycinamide formyltransferase PurN